MITSAAEAPAAEKKENAIEAFNLFPEAPYGASWCNRPGILPTGFHRLTSHLCTGSLPVDAQPRRETVPIPYIGITDFTAREQVWEMLNFFDLSLAGGQKCRLHVGVMMSRKTLLGLETKWAKAFPPKEKIASIFHFPEAMNCLHYADYDAVDLADNLSQAIKWGGANINAVQLDMIWPDHNQIFEAVRRSDKKLEIILQVGEKALGKMGNEPAEVVAMIRNYSGLIHHVLLDKSGGRGLGMDTGALRPFVRAIRNDLPQLGVTVAGGLGPTTLHLVEPLVKEFPGINIDAQGKLRPSGDSLNEPINWQMATQYLNQAVTMFHRATVAA